MSRLENRVALVTGSSRGIGAAIAVSFARQGAKVAVHGRDAVAAAEAGSCNIRANCIAPETILTENNLRQIPDAQKAAMIEAQPLRRLGLPEDVAGAALFLASEDAGWISGIVLDVAGGAVLVR